jgi:ferrous iron transport protein A
MKLAEAPIGQLVTVEHVGGERAFRRRLMELGLVPGTRLELVGVAPLGDPFELLVRGCSLSIRRAEAMSVTVAKGVVERPARNPEPQPAPATSSLGGCPGCAARQLNRA